MAQVKTNMLRLVQKIDPRRKDSGLVFSSANVSSADGDRFTAQRQLDIYNEARIALFQALRASRVSPSELGQAVIHGTLAFVSGSVSLPTGFIEPLGPVTDSTGKKIYVVGPEMEATIIGTTLPVYTQSLTNRFVVFRDNKFVFPSWTSGLLPNGNYSFDYYGLTPWTLLNVTNSTPPLAEESFNEKFIPILLEVAQAIADEDGQNDPMKLALTLIKKGA